MWYAFRTPKRSTACDSPLGGILRIRSERLHDCTVQACTSQSVSFEYAVNRGFKRGGHFHIQKLWRDGIYWSVGGGVKTRHVQWYVD